MQALLVEPKKRLTSLEVSMSKEDETDVMKVLTRCTGRLRTFTFTGFLPADKAFRAFAPENPKLGKVKITASRVVEGARQGGNSYPRVVIRFLLTLSSPSQSVVSSGRSLFPASTTVMILGTRSGRQESTMPVVNCATGISVFTSVVCITFLEKLWH